MPNAAPLVLNNGTADVTLSPDSVTGTHVQYQNLAEGELAKRDLFHFDRPANGKDVRRSFRINHPVARTVAGVEVIDMVTVKVELVSPSTVGVADRTAAVAMATDALGEAAVRSVFCNPEWVW